MKYTDLFTTQQLTDKIVVSAKDFSITMRITLFMNENLAQHLTKVLSFLPAPFYLKCDMGYSATTPKNELTKFYASRNSAMPLKTFIIRDNDDILSFFAEIGLTYSTDLNTKNDYSMLVEKVLSNHDNRFGIISNSHFSLDLLAYMEVYLHCDKGLVRQWEGG